MAGGRSDVEVLSRSFRSRILLLVLLLAAGLAAAVWTGTRETGQGAAEDRRRIMVVTGEGGGVNYYAVLERAGFAIEVDRYADWEAEARTALPKSEAEGVARVLELADERGFALVVFEEPAELDFGGLELEPDVDAIERWSERDYAALSVGDYGFPHRLSVDDPGEDPVVRLPGYGALQAVFRQELVGARADPERPTIEELQYEDAIELGREMVERPAQFAETIEAARGSVEAALDDGTGGEALVPALATGSPIPTPDGGLLLFHHELEIFSDDARTLELEAAPRMQLSWLGPEAVTRGLESGRFEPEPCPSLAGGALNMAEQPRIEAAADGSAVAIGAAGAGAIVWRKQGPGCTWADLAELETLEAVVLAPRLRGGDRTLAARVEHDDARSRVLVWALADDAAGSTTATGIGSGDERRPEPEVLLAHSTRRFGALAFVDDRHIAVTSDLIPSDEPPRIGGSRDHEYRIYILDRTRPGVYLSVPLEFFAEGRKLRELAGLAPAGEGIGLELLLTAQRRDGRSELIRLRIAAGSWERLASEGPGESDEDAGVEGRMVSLTPEELEATVVTTGDDLHGLSVGPRGQVAYLFRDGPGPGELGLLELESGEVRRLTDNDVRDYLPRFGGEGRYLTFVSLMRVRLSTTPFSVPRLLELD